MDTGLAGKVVVVTGATSNIGKGVALAFAAEGAIVVVVGRDERAGKRVLDQALRKGAAGAFWRAADVTVEADVHSMVTDVIDHHGRIDVLVNNVGGHADLGPFADSTAEQWRFDIDINLTSTLLVTHTVLPHMLAQGSGRIVNIGSMAAIIGDRLLAVYSAAKGAVHAFTRVLALELGTTGITVNAVAPYATRSDDPEEEFSSGSRYHPEHGLLTRAVRERPEELRTMMRSTAIPRKRALPSEIGGAAVYLASEQAAFVTGQVHQVDGGAALV